MSPSWNPRVFALSILTIVALLQQHDVSAGQESNPSWDAAVDGRGNVLFRPLNHYDQGSKEQAGSTAPGTIAFVPGHYYTSNFFQSVITEYDNNGAVVGSYTFPPSVTDDVRGIAFGPDNLLYVAMSRSAGDAVVAIDNSGTIHMTYTGNLSLCCNLSYGKLAFDNEFLYVAGNNQLTRFTRGNPSPGVVIYTENQIFDVKPLPNGNLFVASAYYVDEITASGAFVRRIELTGGQFFTDIRGIEYNPETNILFVTHLGHSGFSFQIMRVDGTTGALLNSTTFIYADDLFLDLSGNLLVGSRSQNPTFFSQNLVQGNSLNGGQQMFVTQYAPLTAQSIVSRKVHGAAGTFDIALPGIECRTGGQTGDYTVVVTFANVPFVTGSPQAQVTAGGATIGSGGISNGGMVTVSGNTVMIPITNVANAQTVGLQLNGVISGPSRGNLAISMTLLVADVNGNGSVNASDVAFAKAQTGQPVGPTNFRADVNADGVLSATDVALVKSRLGGL